MAHICESKQKKNFELSSDIDTSNILIITTIKTKSWIILIITATKPKKQSSSKRKKKITTTTQKNNKYNISSMHIMRSVHWMMYNCTNRIAKYYAPK